MSVLSPAAERGLRAFFLALDLISDDLDVVRDDDGMWVVQLCGSFGYASGLGSALIAAIDKHASQYEEAQQ